MARWLWTGMQGAALAALMIGAGGCSSDDAEQIDGAGLSASRADAWKPQRSAAQPGDDARRTKQLREYAKTTIKLGNGEFAVVVADAIEKRNDGLAFVDRESFEDQGMLFMMPAGEPELAVRNLEFDVDVMLIDERRTVIEVGSLNAPGGAVGKGSNARYILLTPKGIAGKYRVAQGQSVGMQGGAIAVSGV